MSLGARRRRPPTPGFVANELWRRAGEVPSFHIAPARTQNATDLITGSVLGTYNSASPAWAVGPDGVLFQPAANAPVIEHDPVTLQCLGARIWGVVTNLLLRSEELGNAAWSRGALTVSSDVTTSPKGIQDADKLVESATNAEHGTWQTRSAQSEIMTLSVFAKASERSRIKIGFSNFATAGSGAIFNLSTGTVISTDAANADYTSPAASIIAYPAGWYRCVFTVTKGTANNNNIPYITIVNNSNQTIYAGDGTSGVFTGGTQLQAGSTLGPYVPTTTTTASSTADVWSITGADFGRIWNQSAATMYVDAVMASATSTGNQFIARASDNTYNNQISLGLTSGGFPQFVTASGGTFDGGAGSSTIITANAAFKLAAAGQLNDLALSHSSSIFTDSLANTPTSLTRLDIGSDHMGFNRVVGMYLREFAIFRSRRPNANLQAMPQ